MTDHLSDEAIDILLRSDVADSRLTTYQSHLDQCEKCFARFTAHVERELGEIAGSTLKQNNPLSDSSEWSGKAGDRSPGDGFHAEFDAALIDRIGDKIRVELQRATSPGDLTQVTSTLAHRGDIGIGGLGHVFEYIDQQTGRSVAVKMLQDRWSQSPRARGRFRREMELTATIDHPGCPAVYGIGQSADGREYYLMQLVKGDEFAAIIAEYHQAFSGISSAVDRGHEPFRRILNRFQEVCQTIQSAHDLGIIHRDLKPGNIRLHQSGHAVVLDWGMAKRVNDPAPIWDATDDFDASQLESPATVNGNATQQGQRLGTLLYMSPEQARGDVTAMNSQTDIYGLGGVLHEILTGEPPHRSLLNQRRNGESIEAAIAAGHVPTMADVDRELRSICQKCLAIDPADRYASAIDLDRDIERWLAGQPVVAHAYSMVQRGVLMIRRQPALFATLAASTVALSVLITSVGYFRMIAAEQSADAANQRQVSEQRFAAAYAAYDSMINEVQASLQDLPATRPARQRLLEHALAGIETLLAQAELTGGADRLLALAHHDRARLTFLEMGDTAGALKMYTSAAERWQAIVDADPNDELAAIYLWQSLDGAGEVTETQLGISAAQSWYGLSRAVAESGLARFPDSPKIRAAAASGFIRLGQWLEAQPATADDAVMKAYHQGLVVLQQDDASQGGEVDPSLPYVLEYQLSRALEGIAYWQARQGDFSKSLIIRQRLMELGRKWVTINPGRKNRLSLLIDLNNLGNNFKNTERFEEAKSTFQEALLAHEKLRADYPDDDEVQSQFTILCNNYAELLIETGEPQRVIDILARVRIAVSDHDLLALSIKRLDEAALIEYVQARALKAMEDWSASRLCYADVIRYRMAICDRSAADDYGSNDNLERLLGSVVMVGLTGINDGAIDESTQLVQTTLAKLDTGEAGNRWNPQRRIDLLKAYKMLGDQCQHRLSVLPAEAGESRARTGALAVKALKRAMGLAETIPDLPSVVMEDLRSAVDAVLLAVPSMAEF